jgi:NADP-dependent 3-hydroxy acid dehydrogenase YdfG
MNGDYYRDRVIWITGGSSGIGEACAREFAARGARVALSARRIDRLDAIADDVGRDRVFPFALDATSRDGNLRVVAEIVEALGGIDTVFLNAGTWEPTDLAHWNSDDFQRMMDVNFIGIVKGIEAALPALRRSKRGHLVGMSSSVAFRGIPRAEAYCASKAATRAMLQALRCQLHPLGIPVTVVLPGFVRSPLTDRNDFPMPFLMETAKAARIIADGVARRKTEIRFPTLFIAALRLLSILPDRLYTRLMAQRIVET